MRCIGITKHLKRCRLESRGPYCGHHRLQPLAIVSTVIAGIAIYAGLYQDLVRPLLTYLGYDTQPSRLSVRIESNRSDKVKWSFRDAGITEVRENVLSDLVEIATDEAAVHLYEFYNEPKSSAFDDYPATVSPKYSSIPSIVRSKVIDADADGRQEAVLVLENAIWRFHPDGIRVVIVVDVEGTVISTAPPPTILRGLQVRDTGPYSAYRRVGRITNVDGRSWSVSYVNEFSVGKSSEDTIFSFLWIVDSACFSCPHIYQVDQYTMRRGNWKKAGTGPFLVLSEKPNPRDGALYRVDLETANNYIAESYIPPFEETMKHFAKRKWEFRLCESSSELLRSWCETEDYENWRSLFDPFSLNSSIDVQHKELGETESRACS